MKQRSEEWFAARRGKVTASRVFDIIPGKSGYKSARKNYMAQLLCEIMTNTTEPTFTSAAMQWGTDTEPLAVTAYELKTGNTVHEVGFLTHPEIEGLGGSPDGLVNEDGNLEIKCPNTATHIETLVTGKIKPVYLYQIQVCLMVTGRAWCDFVSYDPRLPEPQDLFIKRVYPDPMLFATIKVEVGKFMQELDLQLSVVRAYEG